MNRDEALKSLQAHGMRLTSPRRAILDVMLASVTPLNADEVRERTGTAGSRSDLSTVYRNLNAFVEAGLLDTVPGGNGERRYILRGTQLAGLRLVCLDCGKILSLPDSELKQVGQAAARQGFDPLTVTVAAHCSHLCEAEQA